MITIKPARQGIGAINYVDCDCVWQNGLRISGECDALCYVPTGYLAGKEPPHHALPATQELPRSFITALWLNAKYGKQERKVRKWWLALCFDANGHYLG